MSQTPLPPGYALSTERAAMQADAIHEWLSMESYWAAGIPFDVVRTVIDNSAVAGVFYENRQIGFARLVTDYAVFAYLADVYVAAPHRGKGLGKALCSALLSQEWVSGLRRIALGTRDAHSLYASMGFGPLKNPDRHMEIILKTSYRP